MVSTTRRLTAVAGSSARFSLVYQRNQVLLAVSSSVAGIGFGKAIVLTAVSQALTGIWAVEKRAAVEATWRLIRPVGTWVIASADWLHRLRGA